MARHGPRTARLVRRVPAEPCRCARALSPHVDWDLLAVVRGDTDAPSLDRVDVVEPALFAVMVALAAVWRSMGVEPDAVVGHSQGEYRARRASPEPSRSTTPQKSSRSGVGRSPPWLAAVPWPPSSSTPPSSAPDSILFNGRIALAAINGPSSCLVSGETAAVQDLVDTLSRDQIFARKVRVDYASHGPAVDPLRDDLIAALGDLTRPALPCRSILGTGRTDRWHDARRHLLVRQSPTSRPLPRHRPAPVRGWPSLLRRGQSPSGAHARPDRQRRAARGRFRRRRRGIAASRRRLAEPHASVRRRPLHPRP